MRSDGLLTIPYQIVGQTKMPTRCLEGYLSGPPSILAPVRLTVRLPPPLRVCDAPGNPKKPLEWPMLSGGKRGFLFNSQSALSRRRFNRWPQANGLCRCEQSRQPCVPLSTTARGHHLGRFPSRICLSATVQRTPITVRNPIPPTPC